MRSHLLIMSTGFAMFSMFFGSGNLVFPVEIGAHFQDQWMSAAFGIFLTGVIGPFVGLCAILLYDGCTRTFFGQLGRAAQFLIPLVALSLMGPFGVLARCFTVAHGALHVYWTDLSLFFFGLVFAGLIVFFCRHRSTVSLLGTVLTPLLLLSLAAIAFVGLTGGESPAATGFSGSDAVIEGAFIGYQMMDLIAAFFFSAFVVSYLKRHTTPAQLVPTFLRSAAVGVGLLAAVYVSLVALGAVYAQQLVDVPPQEMLGTIASLSLGSYAGLTVCVAVGLACLTTAIALATLYAEFLKTEILPAKSPEWLPMGLTLVIALGVSLLEFSGIAAVLGPVLSTVYPALIVLALLGIANKLWNFPFYRWPALAMIPLKWACS